MKEQVSEQLKQAVEYGPDNPAKRWWSCKKRFVRSCEWSHGSLNYGLKKFPNQPEMLFIARLSDQREKTG
ncbi:MAG: hypothetical protein R3C24_19940 [Cyanobacteriota/Melainabacteria group bacterium]